MSTMFNSVNIEPLLCQIEKKVTSSKTKLNFFTFSAYPDGIFESNVLTLTESLDVL